MGSMPQDPRGGIPGPPEKNPLVDVPKSGVGVFCFLNEFAGTHSAAIEYDWALALMSPLARLGTDIPWDPEHQRAFEVMAYGEALPSQAALETPPKDIPFEWAEGGPPPSWFMEGPWPRETPDSHYWTWSEATEDRILDGK